MKILNTVQPLTPEAKEILEQTGEVVDFSLTQSDVSASLADVDAAFIGLGFNFHKDVLEQAPRLKVIATATTGLDHIDVAYAKEKGIEVLSLRGEEEFLNTITGTAELSFGLLLDLSRSISNSFADVKNGNWEREKFRGHTLFGKTMGIVGLGRLGKMMARYAQGFGMKVIAFDPHISDDVFTQCGVEKTDFETLLKNSDVISIHVHLTTETENMFDAQVFCKMKPHSMLINTARGKIVNEKELLQALESKQIAGYAADVLCDELNFGKNISDPLIEYAKTYNNVIITPHIGGMTQESREATDIFIAQKLVRLVTENK